MWFDHEKSFLLRGRVRYALVLYFALHSNHVTCDSKPDRLSLATPSNNSSNIRPKTDMGNHSLRTLEHDSPRFVVVVRVTTRCTQSCQYCGFSSTIPRDRTDIDLLSLKHLGLRLRSIAEGAQIPILVSWLGGEPYQWRDLWPATDYFRNELQLPVSITTNGVALASDTIRHRTIESMSEITISVDGPAEHHDRVRTMSSQFEQIKENCCKLVQEDTNHRLWKRINSVLTSANIQSFASTCRELASWGIDEITFNPLGGNDRPEFFAPNRLNLNDFDTFRCQLPTLRQELSEYGVRLSGSEAYLERIASTILGIKIPVADCKPATRFLFIDEHGHISPCSFTNNQYFVSLNDALSLVDLSLLTKELSDQRRATPCSACNDCHANHIYDKFDRNTDNSSIHRTNHQGSYCV